MNTLHTMHKFYEVPYIRSYHLMYFNEIWLGNSLSGRNKEQLWLGGLDDGLAPSKRGFSSRQYPCESLVAAGRASSQNYSRGPVKSYLDKVRLSP